MFNFKKMVTLVLIVLSWGISLCLVSCISKEDKEVNYVYVTEMNFDEEASVIGGK